MFTQCILIMSVNLIKNGNNRTSLGKQSGGENP